MAVYMFDHPVQIAALDEVKCPNPSIDHIFLVEELMGYQKPCSIDVGTGEQYRHHIPDCDLRQPGHCREEDIPLKGQHYVQADSIAELLLHPHHLVKGWVAPVLLYCLIKQRDNCVVQEGVGPNESQHISESEPNYDHHGKEEEAPPAWESALLGYRRRHLFIRNVYEVSRLLTSLWIESHGIQRQRSL